MSALPPRADIAEGDRHAAKCQKETSAASGAFSERVARVAVPAAINLSRNIA